ncbi:MAG: GTPase ObgE [Candidatus Portnoybacteria bacterium]|nr:GTPase ObgE [Candidatus Portnoybacteria bacterium]MDD4983140.1 GTPase ObgE [Candidatus Portnoybacteria bacterium]
MLIDDVTIKVKAGNGGNGSVAFNKTKMSLGPTGADGGHGGSVYLEVVSDLAALVQFRYKKEIIAKNGERGKTQLNDGSNGPDIVLRVPVGTVIHNLTTGEDLEIVAIGQKVLIAKGGRGGRGNYKFRSAINTSPEEFEEGTPGQERELRLELKMIADVGFVGLPNVGKSSLLNEVTRAKSKVANYHFTTLDPNLGAYYELILADLPGLIEGAAEGKGLGIKFLRHTERTKALFHFVSAESADPVKDYNIIRRELGAHNKALLDKPEYVFLSKEDMLSKEEVAKKLDALKTVNKDALPISIHDMDSIKRVKKILREIIKLKY